MTRKVKHIIAYIISIFLIIFWLFVGLEKAWSWQNFRISLQQQPLPQWSMSILFWLVPLIEIATGILLAFQNRKLQRLGYWGSILLLTAFTIFIGLGVAGVYEKRPCTCSSIFNEMSWEWHLVVNIILLSVSILGLFMLRPASLSSGDSERYSKSVRLFIIYLILSSIGTVQSRPLGLKTNAFVMPQKMTTYPSNLVYQFKVS
ncbi:MauE/DoxX family redox-associated membrane protein [Sphingobacterium sp. JUb56]|uniref:MauE/DoxX family redox-associated membrane protein n=1 Tax=Sphingobacterium sp. JUb56 TaxID=2587145 RepID=UPI00162041CE|nr:MauE/DoxX family redox-associated membrane protein [Sphingobacterium sp. JUb56]MBB2949333.1 putative membrane protein YkvI [Sphingobacterium sp. JUb56]